ncbi:hypothetical protein GSI_10051 [Ganoderma sinense ZZ0214-1]|uniref:Uncharacterized protein n=1 Tax=Ganoderma sinense ZZ0214-1 TaxID=1077348 RepID=A0A2G8RZG4_9APHY|nr:hypothetical protein GSI_10051 [Ganoderma sinense ZZ0214-1]
MSRTNSAHLYHSEVNVHWWDPDTALTLSLAVRTANKYLVDGLRAYLVQKAKDDWPLTIEDWDGREAEIEAMSVLLSRTDATYAWDRPESYNAHQDLSARRSLRSSLPLDIESVYRV